MKKYKKTIEMDFTKITTPELTIFQNKIISFIKDVDVSADKLNRLMSMKGQQNIKNQHILDKLRTKTKQAEKLYNKIQLELEKRIKKKTGFFMDYNEVTKTLEYIDEEFSKSFIKPKE